MRQRKGSKALCVHVACPFPVVQVFGNIRYCLCGRLCSFYICPPLIMVGNYSTHPTSASAYWKNNPLLQKLPVTEKVIFCTDIFLLTQNLRKHLIKENLKKKKQKTKPTVFRMAEKHLLESRPSCQVRASPGYQGTSSCETLTHLGSVVCPVRLPCPGASA